jgi:hypothetical protein
MICSNCHKKLNKKEVKISVESDFFFCSEACYKIWLWKNDAIIHKECSLSISSALKFSKNEHLSSEDLICLLDLIKSLSKKSKVLKLDKLRQKCSYSVSEFDSLIERLKKLGEIFNPDYAGKDTNKTIALI